MKNGAFNQTFMTGADYAKWVEQGREAPPVADEGSGLPRHQLIEPQIAAGGREVRWPAGLHVAKGSRAGFHELTGSSIARSGSVPPGRSKSASPCSSALFGVDRDLRQREGRHRLGRRRPACRVLPVLCRAARSCSRARSICGTPSRTSNGQAVRRAGVSSVRCCRVVIPTAIYVARDAVSSASMSLRSILIAWFMQLARQVRLADRSRRSRSACRSSPTSCSRNGSWCRCPKGPLEDLLDGLS